LRTVTVAVVMVLCGSTARAQGSLDAESVYLGTYGGTICQVRTGSGAPSGGNTCDSYVDTATGNLYTKRAGSWTLIPRTEISNTWAASQTVTGTMTATTFAGSGASLTSLPAAQVTENAIDLEQDVVGHAHGSQSKKRRLIVPSTRSVALPISRMKRMPA